MSKLSLIDNIDDRCVLNSIHDFLIHSNKWTGEIHSEYLLLSAGLPSGGYAYFRDSLRRLSEEHELIEWRTNRNSVWLDITPVKPVDISFSYGRQSLLGSLLFQRLLLGLAYRKHQHFDETVLTDYIYFPI